MATRASSTVRRRLRQFRSSMVFRLPMRKAALEDTLAITVEDPDAEGEQRFISVGLGSAGELLVWTERNGEYRPIAARRPTRTERKHYGASLLFAS